VTIAGGFGVVGLAVMTTSVDVNEVQPVDASVTVNLSVVPPTRPFTVAGVPDPEIEKGVPIPEITMALMVQLPEGNPLKTTFPVTVLQLGDTGKPGIGADGRAFTVVIDDAGVDPGQLPV
jgi:hypothetical protein